MGMAASAAPEGKPNRIFRELRGDRSPGEFAAAVRRAAREIGERVACDARYIGRVEAGEIRCPNYAYERVFIHMFPGRTLTDLGFEPRQAVRGRGARTGPGRTGPGRQTSTPTTEESDVLRRAFMTGGSAALASLASPLQPQASAAAGTPVARPGGLAGGSAVLGRPGETEAAAVRQAVRDIRLLDDRYGADTLYRAAGEALRAAYELVDAGARRQAVNDHLHTSAGELAVSVGWLAHDSGRLAEARSHYAEALATARVNGDAGLEAHAFCNTAFLARDAGRPREAVRAAQAGQQAARQLAFSRLLASPRLESLLALREAGGWAGLGDRRACQEALARAHNLFGMGAREADPEWLVFFGEAELASLEAQCWAALGEWARAAEHARRAVAVQEPRFVRNIALFSAELAGYLARQGDPEEAAAAGHRSLDLLVGVRSSRISAMLAGTAQRLGPFRAEPAVAELLSRVSPASPAASPPRPG
ncbi:tetratricopeptide repeat protein [Streptomyces sp. B6B3]|uniref:tetratricopeptide repeat protein n=1 Tax=Streptomyces sp. B6B3 TaxID=3153570 RepID=UPI00325DF5F7